MTTALLVWPAIMPADPFVARRKDRIALYATGVSKDQAYHQCDARRAFHIAGALCVRLQSGLIGRRPEALFR
jgi:hypothetical protein